ncbi:MAG TPA: hypothetical protein VJZ00_11615 [Thermoanaerobaculia bacterium]|nr:hypothetical protein [Thermoanaerobaculia bacterium]
MPVKLSDDLVQQAREEAKAADRSITSQIEHWARLGRSVETVLRHDDVVALKRSDEVPIGHASKRVILAALRALASGEPQRELASILMRGRVVYQDDGSGGVERIERDGTRSVGRLVGRKFIAEERKARKR